MRRFSSLAAVTMGLIAGAVGCGGNSSDYKKTVDLKKAPAVHAEHDHGAPGPHGGSLVELGDEQFHAEVVLDHDTHTLRVFLLGPDAKTAATTGAKELTLTPEGKTALTLKAAPQEGDAEGNASQFELVDEAAVHEFLDAKMIHAELAVTIGETPFSGHVDYHLDDIHHEHKDAAPKDAAKDSDADQGDSAKDPKTPEATPESKPAEDKDNGRGEEAK